MKDKLGKSPLILACQHNQLDEVWFLVEHDADLDETDIYGNCALVYACTSRNYEIIKLVANTVHIKADSYNDFKSTKILITCGADVNAPNTFGYTPLHYMCSFFPIYS